MLSAQPDISTTNHITNSTVIVEDIVAQPDLEQPQHQNQNIIDHNASSTVIVEGIIVLCLPH